MKRPTATPRVAALAVLCTINAWRCHLVHWTMLPIPAAVSDSRFSQAQHAHPGLHVQYTGFAHCFSTILRQEGLAGLWLPGLLASSMRDVINGAIRLGMYPTLRHALTTEDEAAAGISLSKKLLIGLATGACGAFVGNPTGEARVVGRGTGTRLRCCKVLRPVGRSSRHLVQDAKGRRRRGVRD